MPTMSALPPEWVDKYEECLSMIRDLDEISKNQLKAEKKVLTEQSRRLSSVKASEEKNAERKIYELSSEATLVLDP